MITSNEEEASIDTEELRESDMEAGAESFIEPPFREAAEQGQKVLIEKFFKPQGVYFNMGNNEVRVRPDLGYTRYNSKNENPNFIPFEFIKGKYKTGR